MSKQTAYVVAGESAGSKLTRAQELKIPVLTEDEFIDLIAALDAPPAGTLDDTLLIADAQTTLPGL